MKTRSLVVAAATAVAAIAFTPSLALAASSTPHGATVVHSSAISHLLSSNKLASSTTHVTKATSGPISVSLAVGATGAWTVYADATESTDSAGTITGISYDFGDGSATVSGSLQEFDGVSYQYAKFGTYTVTVTITDSTGHTATASTSVTTAGSDYTAYGPTRVLDTRNGTGTGGTIAKVGSNSTLKLKIAGAGPAGNTIPSGVTAVVLNLTVTDAASAGFVTAYPAGESLPDSSNLNYGPGNTRPNLVIVQVSSDGYVDLTNSSKGSVDLVADVSGYFTASQASQYQAISNYRLLDTRNGTGTGGKIAKVGPEGTVAVTVAGADGGALPSSGITAVAMNLTVTNPNGAGYLTAYGDGTSLPNASNVNYGKGQTVANAVIVPVGGDGKIDINNNSKTSSTDIVADVTGYFTTSTSGTSAYVAIPPERVYDSRNPELGGDGPLDPLPTFYSQPAAPYGMGVTSMVLNATITNPTSAGYLTLFPTNPNQDTVPTSSNLNYASGQTLANLTIDTLGTVEDPQYGSQDLGIAIDSINGQGTANLILDWNGFFATE